MAAPGGKGILKFFNGTTSPQQGDLLVLHCLCHRLELAYKAALNIPLHKQVTDMANDIYTTYHYSSLNRASLRDAAELVAEAGGLPAGAAMQQKLNIRVTRGNCCSKPNQIKTSLILLSILHFKDTALKM